MSKEPKSDWFTLSSDVIRQHAAILEETKRFRGSLKALCKDPSMSPREQSTLAQIDRQWAKIEALMRLGAKEIVTEGDEQATRAGKLRRAAEAA